MAEEKKTAKKTTAKKKVAEKKETKKPAAKATPKKADKKEEKKVEKKVEKKLVKKDPILLRGKNYQDSVKGFDRDQEYTVAEAAKILKGFKKPKFDSSVEIHLNLGIDPKKPEEQIRGSVSLPAGLGKEKKVAVVASTEKEKEAKDAGAEVVGGKELIEKIVKGSMDFDVLVATPDMMGELAKAGKVLGPKGLMPNPKDNTVTNDLKAVIGDIKKGRAEYRADSFGIVHSVVGKASFDEAKLTENIEAFLKEIHNIKPSSVKTGYIKSIYLTTTMGPSVKIKEN